MTHARLALASALLAAPLLATILPAAAFDEEAPRNPISSTRSVWSECGAGAAQQRCDDFIAEYRAWERTRIDSKQDIADRRAEYERALATHAVATLPVVKDASQLAFSAEMKQDIAKVRPRAEGLTQEIRVRFHIDTQGKPYHVSTNPDRLNVNQRDFRMYATPNDRMRVCTPIDEPRRWINLTNAANQGCVAMDGLQFQPALTAAGKPVAATVDARLILTATDMQLVVTKATPILFPRANEATQAFLNYGVQRQKLAR